MTTQTITRKGSFDSAHRVMNERMKCYNVHGHTYLYELTFSFSVMEDIGYALDFKEIKRVACQWIDDMFDHGAILNPKDAAVIRACEVTNSKIWLMSLNGTEAYCNPSVENIAKEIFLGVFELVENTQIQLQRVRLWETPNCYTDCYFNSLTEKEKENFYTKHRYSLLSYKADKGMIEYDDRKLAVTSTAQ